MFLQFFFFKLLPRFNDFVNCDNGIKKLHQNLSDYMLLYSKKRLKINKKGIISSEKMKNAGDYIVIMLTRFSERIFNPSRYTGNNNVQFELSFFETRVYASVRKHFNTCVHLQT